MTGLTDQNPLKRVNTSTTFQSVLLDNIDFAAIPPRNEFQGSLIKTR
jgi:hypothetical protein